MFVCREVASFSEAIEQKAQEHKMEVEAMTNNRAMLEVSITLLPPTTYQPSSTGVFESSLAVFAGKVSKVQQRAHITKKHPAKVYAA